MIESIHGARKSPAPGSAAWVAKVSIFGIGEEKKCVYKDYRKEGPWTQEDLQRVIPWSIEPYAQTLESLKAIPEEFG